jgi:hypothetical protein
MTRKELKGYNKAVKKITAHVKGVSAMSYRASYLEAALSKVLDAYVNDPEKLEDQGLWDEVTFALRAPPIQAKSLSSLDSEVWRKKYQGWGKRYGTRPEN